MFGDELPHQAPDLEEMLLPIVAGRSMLKYSYVGAAFFNAAIPGQLKATEVDLASVGMSLDDVARAVAGRSDVERDPPYQLTST
jgi:hypothetical protein